MQYKVMSAAIGTAVVLSSLALAPAQAIETSAATELSPANVAYTFNKIRSGGIVRDITPPTHRRMLLKGNWARAADVNGDKKAVAFRARSLGIIKRSDPLIPKRRAFAVSMTIKVNKIVGTDSPNLAQIGYYRQRGQWKVEMLPKSGNILFRVKGAKGAGTVASRVSISDGGFHQVTCFRKRAKLGVIVDGTKRVRKVPTGAVTSPRPVTIANKGGKTSSDQFRGVFDYFAIALGPKAVARSVAKAPTIP